MFNIFFFNLEYMNFIIPLFILAMEVDYCDEYISVSKYPLSASNAIGKILNAYEDAWEIWNIVCKKIN